MNHNDETRLIVGLLSPSDPRLVREKSLASALDAVRKEARRRRIARSVSLVCAPAAFGLLLLFTSARQRQSVPPVAPVAHPSAQTPSSGQPLIEPIDDQQLLALLPGKTVALIGPPGREQLLVFDAPGKVQ